MRDKDGTHKVRLTLDANGHGKGDIVTRAKQTFPISASVVVGKRSAVGTSGKGTIEYDYRVGSRECSVAISVDGIFTWVTGAMGEFIALMYSGRFNATTPCKASGEAGRLSIMRKLN
nr:Unknown Function [uncultured bacterium]